MVVFMTFLLGSCNKATKIDVSKDKVSFTKDGGERSINVNADGDEVEDNNSRDFKLYVHSSNLPEPEDLHGVTYADGHTTLIWQKPSKEEMQDAVTDGFDEYESFVI